MKLKEAFLARNPNWVELGNHFGPVVIALTLVAISLGDYSVFEGFDEGEPGTYLSLLLMALGLALTLRAVRLPDLDGPTRFLAVSTSGLLGVAMLDETYRWHEAIGRWVQRNVSFAPPGLLHYTDDTLILLSAVVVALFLYRALRRTGRWKELRRCLFCVGFFAVGHGILDVLNHGNTIVLYFYPHFTETAADSITYQLGALEEWFKVFTEWFAILLFQRLFFRRRVNLIWPLQVFLGTLLVITGVWVVVDPVVGIPYLTVSAPQSFYRNFPSLFTLSMLWLAWAILIRLLFWRDRTRTNLAGLVFLAPLSASLGSFFPPALLGSAVSRLSAMIAPNAYFNAAPLSNAYLVCLLLVPGILLGLILFVLHRCHPIGKTLLLAAALAVAFWLEGGSSFQPQRVFLAAGALGPVAVYLLLRGRDLLMLPLLFGLLSTLFLRQPLWIWLLSTLTLAVALETWRPETPERWPWRWRQVAAVQVAVAFLVVSLRPMIWIPNYRYRAGTDSNFKTLYQRPRAVDPEAGR